MASLVKGLCSNCSGQLEGGQFNASFIPTVPNAFDIGSLGFPIQSLYVGTDVILGCASVIRQGTADAADNCVTTITGGGLGTVGNGRGATVYLYGNEHANVGLLSLDAGASASILLRTVNVTRWQVDSGGVLSQGAGGLNIVLSIADTGIQLVNGFSTVLPASLTTVLGTNPLLLLAKVAGSVNRFGLVAAAANTSGGTLNLLKTRATTLAATTIVASGDSLGDIIAWGADGTSYQNAAMIRFTCSATPGAGDMPGSIEFWCTTDGSTTLANRWTMSNNGDLSGNATTGRHILMNNPAAGLFYKAGANGHAGTFVANGSTGVVVNTTAASATMTVQFGLNTVGGTPAGYPFISAIVPGTSFTVKAEVGDTSTYNWSIIRIF